MAPSGVYNRIRLVANEHCYWNDLMKAGVPITGVVITMCVDTENPRRNHLSRLTLHIIRIGRLGSNATFTNIIAAANMRVCVRLRTSMISLCVGKGSVK